MKNYWLDFTKQIGWIEEWLASCPEVEGDWPRIKAFLRQYGFETMLNMVVIEWFDADLIRART